MSLPAAVEITAIGNSGDGLAQYEGKQIYVPFSLPGERIKTRIEGERGAIERILRPSPDRVRPFCRYFGECGGCQLQHWNADRYREWKGALVEHALSRAGIKTEIAPVIDAQGQGRRRVTLRARKDGTGFNVARTHKVLNIEGCPILVPELQSAFDIARALYPVAGDCDVSVTATDYGLDAAIKADRSASPLRLAPLASQLNLARLALNGEEVVVLKPPEVQIGRAQVRLPVGSFLQATAEAERIMTELALSACSKAKAVADLFCGVGPFALRMAEKAKVVAADLDRQAIAALAGAARTTQGLKQIHTEHRNLFDNPYTAVELNDFDAVIFDPPRAGAETQAKQIARSRVPIVVGVSCDSGTFARDTAILIAGGYRLNRVVLIDQFAWSSHVELVGVFER